MKRQIDQNKLYEEKADKTFGMNTYKALDKIDRQDPKSSPKQVQNNKVTKNKLEQERIEAAQESMSQLADRIETNSFQG